MGGIIPRCILLLLLGKFFTCFAFKVILSKCVADIIFSRALTGVPIAGEIIHVCEGQYWGLIAFAGCSYAAGLSCFIVVKLLQNKRGKLSEKFEAGA